MKVTSLWHACRCHGISPWAGKDIFVCADRQKSKEKKVKEVETWLQGMGHNACNLRLHSFPEASATPGFGTISGKGGICKDQVVVEVPLQAFMSEETAHACPVIGPVIERAGLTTWQGMCLHLLYERARGIKSKWNPYLALLPDELKMVDIHPLMWPKGLSQELLEGSPMLPTLKQRLLNCKEDYEVMLAATDANGLLLLDANTNPVVTEVSTRWAASILLSRAFSLDLDISETDEDFNNRSMVLVPWADMLNHSSSAGNESCLRFDSYKQVACLLAHKNYTEGEQVFDSYGPYLSPSELLLNYGFVDCENKNHRVDLPATYLGPVRGSGNDILLKLIGLPADGTIFSITEAGVDDSAFAWTRAAIASVKELATAGWVEQTEAGETSQNKAAVAMAYFNQPINHENEAEVLRRLLSACGSVLAEYPTSLNEDVHMGNNMVAKFPWAQMHTKLAIKSEKSALRAAWKHLYVMSKKLETGGQVAKASKTKGKKRTQRL